MDMNKAVTAYVRLRDARSALRHRFDEEDTALKEKQAMIEAALLNELNTLNADSMKTPAGTFYRQEEMRPSGSDWDAFYRWVKENDAFEFLEKRITKTAVKEYMELNDGAMPPGVSVHREFVVRVRRN